MAHLFYMECSLVAALIFSSTAAAQKQPPLVPVDPPNSGPTNPLSSQHNVTIVGPLVPNCQGACMLSRILCPAARIRCVVPPTCYQIVPVQVSSLPATNGTLGKKETSESLSKSGSYGGKAVDSTTKSGDICADKSKNCAAFADLCQEFIYKLFMQYHCRKTCGLCDVPNREKSPPSTIISTTPAASTGVPPVDAGVQSNITPATSFPEKATPPLRRLKPIELGRRMRRVKPPAPHVDTTSMKPPLSTSSMISGNQLGEMVPTASPAGPEPSGEEYAISGEGQNDRNGRTSTGTDIATKSSNITVTTVPATTATLSTPHSKTHEKAHTSDDSSKASGLNETEIDTSSSVQVQQKSNTVREDEYESAEGFSLMPSKQE